jgi:multisubunit Na+/H+ antiporter MnhF subunit
MRLALWMSVSLAFTLGWWLAAAELSFTHSALIYFGFGVLGIVICAWPFRLITGKSSLGRITAVSALSVCVLTVAFLTVAIIAGSGTANTDASPSVTASR